MARLHFAAFSFTLAIATVLATSSPNENQVPTTPHVPEDCKQLGVCENVYNYPYKYVEDLIAGKNISFQLDKPGISLKEHEIQACESTPQVTYPFAAKNDKGEWAFIVNTKPDPVQGFLGEICKGNKKRCEYIFLSEAICEQKTMLRRMWALDDKGNLSQGNFYAPSCCSCFFATATTPSQ